MFRRLRVAIMTVMILTLVGSAFGENVDLAAKPRDLETKLSRGMPSFIAGHQSKERRVVPDRPWRARPATASPLCSPTNGACSSPVCIPAELC